MTEKKIGVYEKERGGNGVSMREGGGRRGEKSRRKQGKEESETKRWRGEVKQKNRKERRRKMRR